MTSLIQERLALLERLQNLSVPKEWAFLIARRKGRPYLDSRGETSAAAILSSEFRWGSTPEGWDFWLSVYYGLLAEEEFSQEKSRATLI